MARILIIEDSPFMTEALQGWLAANGFEVKVVRTVGEAFPPIVAWADVIVTDGSTTKDSKGKLAPDGWRLALEIQKVGGKVLVHSAVDLTSDFPDVVFVPKIGKGGGPDALLAAINKLLASAPS